MNIYVFLVSTNYYVPFKNYPTDVATSKIVQTFSAWRRFFYLSDICR